MKRYLLTALTLILSATLAAAWSSKNADKQKVLDDLKAAFTGETTASAKYAAYAEKARSENLPKIALLFEAETIHESDPHIFVDAKDNAAGAFHKLTIVLPAPAEYLLGFLFFRYVVCNYEGPVWRAGRSVQ